MLLKASGSMNAHFGVHTQYWMYVSQTDADIHWLMLWLPTKYLYTSVPSCNCVLTLTTGILMLSTKTKDIFFLKGTKTKANPPPNKTANFGK